MTLTTTGCIAEKIENHNITKRAKEYFATKYDIKQSELKITDNHFYGPKTTCWMSCGENEAHISYEEDTYKITYNLQRDSFGDDYQYEEINKDLEAYIKKKLPYVKTVKIAGLDADVLATSEKYTKDIKEYFTNSIKLCEGCSNKNTYIDVWIEAQDSEQAKTLHSEHRKEIIIELDSLDVSYTILFSREEGDSEYSAFYFYSVSNGGRSPAFMFKDKVDPANNKNCTNKTVNFVDDKIVCS